MAGSPDAHGTVRIVAGEVEARDTTSRLVVPGSAAAGWPPFSRVGETVVPTGRRFPSHAHQGEEVLTYVLEGSAEYKDPAGSLRTLPAGSAALLTAPGRAAHTIGPDSGSTIRWFSAVVQLPTPGNAAPSVQWTAPPPPDTEADGSATRTLVGPKGPIRSSSGLAAEAVAFADGGTSFRRVGHGRRAIVYALRGRGEIDGRPVRTGEAAFVDGRAGVALHGFPGLWAMIVSAPAPA